MAAIFSLEALDAEASAKRDSVQLPVAVSPMVQAIRSRLSELVETSASSREMQGRRSRPDRLKGFPGRLGRCPAASRSSSSP